MGSKVKTSKEAECGFMNPRSRFLLSRSAFLGLCQGLLGTGGSASDRCGPPSVGPRRLLRQGRGSEGRRSWCRVCNWHGSGLDCLVYGRGRCGCRFECRFWCGSWLWCKRRSRLCHGRCLRGWDLWCLLRRRNVSVHRSHWSWRRLRLPVSEIAPGCSVENRDSSHRYAKQDRGYFWDHC